MKSELIFHRIKRSFTLINLLLLLGFHLHANDQGRGFIKGTVVDANSKESLIGATIMLVGTDIGTSTDLDGTFIISNVPFNKYKLRIQYVGYKPVEVDVTVVSDSIPTVSIELTEQSQMIEGVVIVSKASTSNEVAMLSSTRKSLVVQSGISAQQIKKSQDRDASEVIKRVPGITINQNKFVVVRGLAQRYNNVWVNNASVPSTEADTRAFSFDMIPSGQLDNIMIIKSPAPEYPADFSGGFILVNTKDIPVRDAFTIGVSANYNNQTHGKNFYYNAGSKTDFLGFDRSKRPLSAAYSTVLNNSNIEQVNAFSQHAFNNDWKISKINPMADYSLESSLSKSFKDKSSRQWGMLAAANYSHRYTAFTNMSNNSYSIYDHIRDQSVYVDKYTDNQYLLQDRLGGMLNLTLAPNKNSEYSFKNIINQIGQNRYTTRDGYHYESGFYIQRQAEYFYNSRLTYSSQLIGKYKLEQSNIDWALGYSFANNKMPDRRRINLQENDNILDPNFGKLQLDQNDISREFSTLNENSYSLKSNYETNISFGSLTTNFKAGLYGEYRNRDYANRRFYYRWNYLNLPEDFEYFDPVSQILIPENYDANKLYIFEDRDRRNSYQADNILYAGYAAINIPLNRLNIYTGVRYEYNNMTLHTFTDLEGLRTKDYNIADGKLGRIYPSLNATYKFDDKKQLRLAYGASINRQEFREVAPFVYYDFDLFSDVIGNNKLKPAYINNVDLRYEIYPSQEEMISLALFYKHFQNPIEWSYRISGSGHTYFFENALAATNMGAEIEVKKNLQFMGLKNFAWNFNGALIKSKVRFDASSLEVDRPMQGQSSYIINSGLFYQNKNIGLNASLLYNRIGKRITEVGRTDKTVGASINNALPNTYEMPRDIIDFTISKEVNDHLEFRIGIRDLLASKIVFKQFPKFEDDNGKIQERSQITREFQPGRNISLGVNYKF